jgi:hypothetical protein
MKHTQIRTIVPLLVAGFTVTIAVQWSQHTASPRAEARMSALRPTLPAQRPTPTAVPVPVVRRLPYTVASRTEVPPADDTGPPLPLLFAISSHPGAMRDDDEDDTDRTEPSGIARQVDLFNNSGDPLDITVLAVDVPTQMTTRAQLLVRPHAQAHIGTESGLKLESGYQVTLRSRGYQEMSQVVP